MKCRVKGCPGELEPKKITHTVRKQGKLFVIENVPVEICSVCGDTLFAPDAARRVEEILNGHERPSSTAPVYQYAS